MNKTGEGMGGGQAPAERQKRKVFWEVWEKIGILKSDLVASVGRKASWDGSKVQNGL
jgi:hypothetical protein